MAGNSQVQTRKASAHAYKQGRLAGCVLSKIDETASLGGGHQRDDPAVDPTVLHHLRPRDSQRYSGGVGSIFGGQGREFGQSKKVRRRPVWGL